ncbi:MAG: hypothetical protein VZR36_08875 [Prevotella sp.]|nr:hypothetical protein [Prevotella sp.]
MSAPNFHRFNADRYYVILPTIEDADGEVYEREYYDFEDLFDCIIERLKSTDDEWEYNPKFNDVMEATSRATRRSWESPYAHTDSCDLFGFDIELTIYALSGRYSGGNLDYDIKITMPYNCDEFRLSSYSDVGELIADIMESCKENIEDWGDVYGWNTGTWKLQKKHIEKWLIDMLRKYAAMGELACVRNCEEVMCCGGIFSNGEAVYHKVNDDTIKRIEQELQETIDNIRLLKN